MNKDNLYSHNYQSLVMRFPGVAKRIDYEATNNIYIKSIPIKKGLFTLQVSKGGKNLYLHSRIDPYKEAEQLAASTILNNADIIVVFGFGLGYHLEKLIDRFPYAQFYVIELSREIMHKSLETRDLSKILSSPRISFFSNTFEEFKNTLISENATSSIQLVFLRSYRELFKDEFTKVSKFIRTFQQKKDINDATLRRFDRLWTKNTFKNAGFFFLLPGIRELKGKGRGVPSLVIAAGPSLEENFDQIKKCSDRAFLIAVDTVLKPLLANGIIPDFIVTVDPQFINGLGLTPNILSSIPEENMPILVADPAVYPSVLRNYPGLRVISSSVFSPGKIIERFSGHKGYIAAGGSVAVAAFDLARILETDPIVILGLDLSYKADKTHVAGSFIENYRLLVSNRTNPLNNQIVRYIESGAPFIVRGRIGKLLYSDRRMMLYKNWFEKQVPYTVVKVLNATSGGISIDSITETKLSPQLFNETMVKKAIALLRLRTHLSVPTKKKAVREILNFVGYMIWLKKDLNNMKHRASHARKKIEPYIKTKNTPTPNLLSLLQLIDHELLAYREASYLLSMTMQESINEILKGSSNLNNMDAIIHSHTLYRSIEESCNFLEMLIQKVIVRLKKIVQSADNKGKLGIKKQ